MDIVDGLFIAAIIIFSVIVHEVMHGAVADMLGDPTARYAGRLTLNPIPHIDFIGSIVLPLLCAITPGGFFFGWAKPVPYNPYNFQRLRIWGEALVAAGGPLSNLALALIFGVLIRLQIVPNLHSFFFLIVAINCSLAILNLLPIPPLDGSKILSSILPRPLSYMYDTIRTNLERNPFLGFGLIFLLIFVAGRPFSLAVYALANLIAGV